MAPPARAEVVLVSLKNCLVNLPSSLVSVLANTNAPAQNVVVELQYRVQTLSKGAVSSGNGAGFQKSVFVGWTGMPSRSRPASLRSQERSRPGSRDQDLQGVEIDAAFAKLLGLTEGQKLSIFLHLDPPVAHTVNIEPLTPADWEAIELHATFLELNLLSQIRALPNPAFTSKTQAPAELLHPLTLHLSPTSTANILITSLTPPIPSTCPFAKIAPDAEVHVAPKLSPKTSRATRGDARSVASRRSGKSGVSNNSVRKQPSRPKTVFMRGVDRRVASAWFDPDAEQDQNRHLQVWLSKDVISSDALRGTQWVSISVVKPAGLRAQLDQTQMQRLKEQEASEVGLPASRIVARLLPWAKALNDQHAVLSSMLSQILGIDGFSGILVRIEPAPSPLYRLPSGALKFYPFAKESSKKKEGLKFGGESKLSRQSLVDKLRLAYDGDSTFFDGPLTDGMLLPPNGSSDSASSFDGGILRIEQSGQEDVGGPKIPTWIVGQDHKLDFEAQTEVPRPLPLTTMFPSFAHNIPDQLPELVSVDAVIEQCMSNLTLCSSILLTGGIGSGKTSLAHILCDRLRADYLFNVTYFSCHKLVTDEIRVSNIKETLTRLFVSAAWCARLSGQSLIVLDDLDKICPVETELQVGNDNGRSRQITELVCAIVRKYCSVQSGVTLLATAQSKDALNSILVGGHVVDEIIALKAPDKESRRKILQKLTYRGTAAANGRTERRNRHGRNDSGSHDSTDGSWMDPSNPSSRPGSSSSAPADGFHVSPSIDLLEIAGKTDGFMAADLVLLVSRARNQALIRTVSNQDDNIPDAPLTLTKADFLSALNNFTPSSLRNVTLTHSSTTFSSIGGLKSTRNTLLETLLYPTKYAPIFARSPLRLRSGLLLYGYPGCGKTLLASAVAGECNLNFISVKGPEILNKYIGASEKSVRDLFERAQAAKPCVLFFDEFDSIAPKRGHDSTGVTDRVVNQMLTQMDGAEGLEGVYVLAATSRPDLIDPALLRPGRLDKSLLCDMPDADDREDILHAVSEKLHLRPDVSARLKEIATRTDGFSGADLQALMYNAHLEAIHDLLGDSPASSSSSTNPSANGTNGTATSTKSTKPKHSSHTPSFIHFPYSESTTNTTTPTRAEIAAKLAALKLARRREREVLHPRVGQLSNPPAENNPSSNRLTPPSSSSSNTRTGGGDTTVTITWNHIQRALSTTRSSIGGEERKRLAAIYREFVVGRNGEMHSGEGAGREVGGRSSLM